MLITSKQLTGLKLGAKDGEIGKIHEFLFDDEHWTIRYLVADTGTWLTGRQVLISPYSLEPLDDAHGVLPVRLTKQEIEDSPSVATHEPVSRQHENEFYGYYGWPAYWYGPLAWGASAYPLAHSPATAVAGTTGVPAPDTGVAEDKEKGDPHLRSTRAVSGYHIGATDGDIGHVEDFIIDDETWAIRYMVVDTKNWWFGKHILVSPRWIKSVDWAQMKVFVNLTKDAIKQAPEYTDAGLNRDYEEGLHRHYDRETYW